MVIVKGANASGPGGSRVGFGIAYAVHLLKRDSSCLKLEPRKGGARGLDKSSDQIASHEATITEFDCFLSGNLLAFVD